MLKKFIPAILFVAFAFTQCDCQRSSAESQADPKANTTDSVFDGQILKEIRIYENDSLTYAKKSFDAEGNTIFEGQWAAIHGISLPLGVHLFTNAAGVVQKRITYHYPEAATPPVQIQEEMSFHSDGKTPKRSALYRADLGEEREPCGDWLDFTDQGEKKGAIIYDRPCQ